MEAFWRALEGYLLAREEGSAGEVVAAKAAVEVVLDEYVDGRIDAKADEIAAMVFRLMREETERP